jgi:transcriptional regulator with XRE-family HTH domain
MVQEPPPSYGRAVAEWVRAEREALRWSLADLAKEMTARGCPMDRSAVSRIESNNRGVSVTEAAVFARLFGVPLSDLVRPRVLRANRSARKLFDRHTALQERLQACLDQLTQVEAELLELVDEGYWGEVTAALRDSYDGDLTSPAAQAAFRWLMDQRPEALFKAAHDQFSRQPKED